MIRRPLLAMSFAFCAFTGGEALACDAPNPLTQPLERRQVTRLSPNLEVFVARLHKAAERTGADALGLRAAINDGPTPDAPGFPNIYLARFDPPGFPPGASKSPAGLSVVLTSSLLSKVWIGRPENSVFASAVSAYVPMGVGVATAAPDILGARFGDVQLVTDAAQARHDLVVRITEVDFKFAYTGGLKQVTSSDLWMGVVACFKGQPIHSGVIRKAYTSPFEATDLTMRVEVMQGLELALEQLAVDLRSNTAEGLQAYLAKPFEGPPTRRAVIGPDLTPTDPSGRPAYSRQARALMERAWAGEAEAQAAFGAALLAGTLNLNRDPAEGLRWLRKAADQGHAQARARLAELERR